MFTDSILQHCAIKSKPTDNGAATPAKSSYLRVRLMQTCEGRFSGQILPAGTIGRVVDMQNGFLIVDFNSRITVARIRPNDPKIEIVGVQNGN